MPYPSEYYRCSHKDFQPDFGKMGLRTEKEKKDWLAKFEKEKGYRVDLHKKMLFFLDSIESVLGRPEIYQFWCRWGILYPTQAMLDSDFNSHFGSASQSLIRISERAEFLEKNKRYFHALSLNVKDPKKNTHPRQMPEFIGFRPIPLSEIRERHNQRAVPYHTSEQDHLVAKKSAPTAKKSAPTSSSSGR